MRITYRMANNDDVEAMANFWSENSGWDIIDSLEWRRRFTNTPFGDATVAVAFDDDEKKLIGQFVFIPIMLSVRGKEVKAYRPFAPILHESLQTKFGIASLLTGQHPMLKMYKKVSDELSRQNVSLIYIVPDPRWSRVLQAFPFIMTHKFPLWTLALPLSNLFSLPADITIKKVDTSDPGIDKLWSHATQAYSSTIVRNSKTLSWKTSHGDFKIYAVYKQDEMIGLLTVVYKAKDLQWLICDMITKDNDDSLRMTLTAACNKIQLENDAAENSNGHIKKIAILATPPIEKVVSQLGFVKNAYHFTLAIHPLEKNNIDKKEIAPANWYISAND
ncbi:hypothetical protein [Terrimonas alba]|uniref:hypothetical protein n=1 Tax=Terrimonas alba TaxID=3349636 RepID=UPI0035F32139